MLTIENVDMLKSYTKNNEYVIKDIVECNSYNALYFNLIGLYQSFNCYSENSDVIDYIYSSLFDAV